MRSGSIRISSSNIYDFVFPIVVLVINTNYNVLMRVVRIEKDELSTGYNTRGRRR